MSANLSVAENAMTSDIVVSYSPNDLFYTVAETNGNMLTTNDCTALKPTHISWDISCNNTNFPHFKESCINKELCINKENASAIRIIQSGHNGADEKYSNANSYYGYTILNMFNLGIGIVFLIYIINKYRKL